MWTLSSYFDSCSLNKVCDWTLFGCTTSWSILMSKTSVSVQFLPCEFAEKPWWETPRRYLDSCGLNIDAGHVHWEGGHIHREGTKGIWVSTWTLATTCGVLELSYSGTVLLVLLKEVFVPRHYFSWNDLLGGHSVLWNAPMLGRPLLPGMVGNFVL